jgi:hypothetical protein
MLVVKVELHHAVTGEIKEIARSIIYNDGDGTADSGNYVTRTYKGDGSADFEQRLTMRSGTVHAYPRKKLQVWNLVAEALISMGYGRLRKPAPMTEQDMTRERGASSRAVAGS